MSLSQSMPAVHRGSRLQAWRAPRFADPLFRSFLLLCALSLLGIVALILLELIKGSSLALDQFGLSFLWKRNWDPVNGDFGALPFVYGTLVSSLLALIVGVPLSVGLATFSTEMCP